MFEFFAAFILICTTFVFIALSLIIKNKPVQGVVVASQTSQMMENVAIVASQLTRAVI